MPDLLCFKELIVVFDLVVLTSTTWPTKRGVNTDAMGIRQLGIVAIPKPTNIVNADGNEPRIAIPTLVFLQEIYWDIILTLAVIIIVTIGKPNHRTKLNDGIESFNLNIKIIIKRNKIATGKAVTNASVLFDDELVVSGLDITN